WHTAEVSPKSWAAKLAVSTMLYEQKRIPEAIEYRRGAVEIYPSPVTYRALGALLLESNRPAEAIEPLQKALDREPGLERARCDLGQAYLQSGHPTDAIRELKRALADHPEDAR